MISYHSRIIIRQAGHCRIVAEFGYSCCPVTVFSNQQHAHSPQIFLCLRIIKNIVLLGTINEYDPIRHLFYRTGIAQIAQHREMTPLAAIDITV